eukprot:167277_1
MWTLCLFLMLISTTFGGGNGRGGNGGNGNKNNAPNPRAERKRKFKQFLDDAIKDENDLDPEDDDLYTEYAETFGKLDKYLEDKKFGKKKFARRYRAFEQNKKRIEKLNRETKKPEDKHAGRPFKDAYGINEFTDLDVDDRKKWLKSKEQIEGHSGEQQRRRLTAGCITLPANYFDANKAASNIHTDMLDGGRCGTIKNQGQLGSCWAFSATGQFQCNNNYQRGEEKVFSEKYGTDCSGDSQGRATTGGWPDALSGFYTTSGACDNYYKQYTDTDRSEINGDCQCRNPKVYGQCYALYNNNNPLTIANAANGYAWTFGIYVTNDFFDVKDYYYGCAGKATIGGHAMTIVGHWYGDWILVRNSWGPGWGMGSYASGYVWFHKDVWASCSHSAFGPISMTYLPRSGQHYVEHKPALTPYFQHNRGANLFDSLYYNEILRDGQGLMSQNRRFTAVMQHDGNLVTYDGNKATWANGMHGTGDKNRFLIMQTDNNLCMYADPGGYRWCSMAYGGNLGPNTRLIMQNDGNLVVYDNYGWFKWGSFQTPWKALSVGSNLVGDVENGINDDRNAFLDDLISNKYGSDFDNTNLKYIIFGLFIGIVSTLILVCCYYNVIKYKKMGKTAKYNRVSIVSSDEEVKNLRQ